MSDFRPRGLGRGLSALLGEPRQVERPEPQPEPPQPAWIPPAEPANFAPEPPPIMEPPPIVQPPQANVVELQTPYHAAPQPSAPHFAPTPAAPAVTPPADGGPRTLPIDLVQRNPNQPRRHFDEAELAELSDSIRSHGVLQPILVRPLEGGRYEIVAGERRWRAAQRAGLHAIPAVIRELDESAVLEIAIIENVQRADLNPIEEAQGYQSLIDRFGHTQQGIADVVGKSRPHIANMLRLLALPEEILDMVRDGRLSAGHARAILTAPDPRTLAARTVSEGLNVREVERLAAQAKDVRDGARVSGPGAEKDADTRALEKSLSDALGLAVVINDKNGAGDLRISYRTLEQLDDLARRLRGGF